LPTAFSFDGAAPNPTSGRASIRYGLPGPAEVRISVYSAAGTWVRALQSGVQPTGRRCASWDGRDARGRAVRAGVYLVRMEAGRFSATRKLVVRR
jgi:flagellar hook assembly protein FlgD